MKDLRDLKDWMIHHVKPICDVRVSGVGLRIQRLEDGVRLRAAHAALCMACQAC